MRIAERIRRAFVDHPERAGECYLEHACIAAGFGARMIAGGLACIVHAAFPMLFETRASDTIAALNAKMLARRTGMSDPVRRSQRAAWPVDYQI